MPYSTPAWRWASLAIFLFVFAVAVFTRNSGLFILAGVTAGATALAWTRRR